MNYQIDRRQQNNEQSRLKGYFQKHSAFLTTFTLLTVAASVIWALAI